MFSKLRARLGGGSMGSAVLGGGRLNGAALKRLLLIGAATVGLVVIVSATPGPETGPLFVAATGFLVAFLDFHRKNRRVFTTTLSVLPVMALWAWAAGGWHLTQPATEQAAMLGNQASMAGGDQLKALAIEAITVGVPTMWHWFTTEGAPRLFDALKTLIGSFGGGS